MSNSIVLQGDTAAKDGLEQVHKDIQASHKARAKGSKHLTLGDVDWATLRVAGVTRYPTSGNWEYGEPKKEAYLRWTVEVPVTMTRSMLNG